ncbi:fungal trichothecene efflux pump [Leptodontidium sp. MPI-SDFR-AT-0119]|nr:fungal trichothecene efflux pump [Leptodontidium sp. MPI-SDFR-AT-0119]
MAHHSVTALPLKQEVIHTEDVESPSGNITEPSSSEEEDDGSSSWSWRTQAAVFALSLAWGASTFGLTGPNSAIGYVVNEYPESASDGSWIANTPLFCIVTLPPILGAASDRYGKRWFLIIGGLLGVIGSAISGKATSMNMVIGGQTLCGIAGANLTLGVPAGMEVVAAKHRTLVVSVMSFINSVCSVVSLVAFGACIERGLDWRWGFRILACVYALAVVMVVLFFNPPPPRLRQQGTFTQLLKSIDFIGILLLSSGGAILAVALAWGGVTYPWKDAHIIPLLIAGPVLLILFGLYEWKCRPDGIMHHAFFESHSFVVYMIFGTVDGMLLYGLSVFIPKQLLAVYYPGPLMLAGHVAIFYSCLLAGFMILGFLSTKTKAFKWPLVISSLFLTLFCGLTANSKTSNKDYFLGMIAMDGLLTAATEVFPVAGIGLIVPHHLIGTSISVLSTFRGLGGAVGISIFTSVYNNKVSSFIPEQVTPVLVQANLPQELFPTIFQILFSAPAALASLPILTADNIKDILVASAIGAARGFKEVWFGVMGMSAICLVVAFLIVDTPEKMTDHIESKLEKDLVSNNKYTLSA